VAPFICYDLRFPEAFRVATRRGAQVLAVIANWPAAREGHWMTLLRARAIENQTFVIGVNRCGTDPNHTYSGRSQIIDPRGEILADAGSTEGLIHGRLDLQLLTAYRNEFPALRDMRDDLLSK
jgi:omega-amidase